MGVCGSKPELLEVKRVPSLPTVPSVTVEEPLPEAEAGTHGTAPVAGTPSSTLPPWMKQSQIDIVDDGCVNKNSVHQDPIAEVLRINLSEVWLSYRSRLSATSGAMK